MGETNGGSMDMFEHQQTYKGFLSLTKWATILNVVVLILMAIFLL